MQVTDEQAEIVARIMADDLKEIGLTSESPVANDDGTVKPLWTTYMGLARRALTAALSDKQAGEVKTAAIAVQTQQGVEAGTAPYPNVVGGDIAASIKQAVGECLAGMLYSDVSKDARRKIEKAIDLASAPAPGWLDMASAPKDGTMLRLLVNPDQDEFTAFDDSLTPYETIGSNSLADTGEDRWEFAGWDWQQDCFITGRGEVIGWSPFKAAEASQIEAAVRWCLDRDQRNGSLPEAYAERLRAALATTPSPETRYALRSALVDVPAVEPRKFKLGDHVCKTKGSSWVGHVVGFYSTELTPVGYAVESSRERGSVQIYPEAALKLIGLAPHREGEDSAEVIEALEAAQEWIAILQGSTGNVVTPDGDERNPREIGDRANRLIRGALAATRSGSTTTAKGCEHG